MPLVLLNRARRRGSLLVLWLIASTGTLSAQDGSLTDETWLRPAEPVAQAILAPRHLNVTLTNESPDRRWFLNQTSDGMPSMTSFAKRHLWFAGLQLDPAANRVRTFTTRASAGLSLIEAASGRTIEVEVPRGARVTGAQWSPDASKVAFFASFDDATHIYVADVPDGRSRQITRSPVLATLTTTFGWTSDGNSIVTVLVPQNRGPAPRPPTVPVGPQVRLTSEGENRLRTYASLLEWPYEQDLLEYHATGQLAIIDVASRRVRNVGAPAMIRSVDVAPTSEYLRVTTMQKPFSYIVPVTSFATKEELWSADGRVVAQLADRPVNEGIRTGDADNSDAQDGSVDMRNIAWRPDGAGLSYLQREPAPAAADSVATPPARPAQSERAERPARRKDRVMLWAPPFTEETKRVVYESDTRMSGVRYSEDGQILFVTEGAAGGGFGGGMRGGSGTVHQYAVFVNDPTKTYTLYRSSRDDFYNDPGSLQTRRGQRGQDVVQLSIDGMAVFLNGTQHFEDPLAQAPRPFIDRVDIRSGEKTRIYEGENTGLSEQVVAVLDNDATRIVVSRESPTQVPDAWLRDANGELRRLTNNSDYNPEITRAQRKRFTVTRADGFTFKVDITLPADYRPGTRLPAMFWFYPREYTDQESYDRTLRTYNTNRFPTVGPRSMEFLTLLGYAVVTPDAPIIGETGRMNDSYEHDLRNNLAAAIDVLDREGLIDRDRLGIGGHSYGAFSTVNAMVHTPFFKAGIAGDGNYNRTLTPLGFQTERRDLYQGRETYLAMSPYLYANNLTGALLLYHGMDDQNVGTHLTHSVRLFHVLNGLGKTASLYMYPYEDHGPVTEQTVLDLWARWTAWLDRYVKNAGTDAASVTTQQ